MTRRNIRYAVVGLGHIAQVAVLPAFARAPNSQLTALVSGEPEKLKKLGRKYGVAGLYSDDQYEQALTQVDAVYITEPNHLHRDYAIRAATAGVHVLCEKPMAPTQADCRAMIHAAENNRVKLMIAYRLHFERGNQEAVRLAESGRLGEVRFFTSEFAQQVVADNVRVTEPPERGGGPVYDMGVYCINAARNLFRAEPVQVVAITANNGEPRFSKTEEMTSVVMRFPGERVASFICSFGAADISRYSLIGSKGVLTVDPAYEYAQDIQHRLTFDSRTRTKTFPKRDQFAPELIYFSNCVLEGKTPEPSGEEGLRDVRVVEAIYQSARTARFVLLPELAPKRRPGLRQELSVRPHEKPKTVRTKSPSGKAA